MADLGDGLRQTLDGEESEKVIRTLAAVMLLAACASPPEPNVLEGYWRFVHDVNGPQETRSDEAICRVGYLSSPRAARGDGSYRARRASNAAEGRHVDLCMTALGYRYLWFDAECQRGCWDSPSLLRACAERARNPRSATSRWLSGPDALDVACHRLEGSLRRACADRGNPDLDVACSTLEAELHQHHEKSN